MNSIKTLPGCQLQGRTRIPGDKSISHRALLFGALADGTSWVTGFLSSHDCLATLGCLRSLGLDVGFDQKDSTGTSLFINGKGLTGLEPSASPLNCVRSGTTMRLLSGIMAAQPFDSTLTGEDQLLRRPMKRVTEPLIRMGADITTTEGHAPLYVKGRKLSGIHHNMAIASAQVKSAILLAGLFSDGITSVNSNGAVRDHTERMLALMGAKLIKDGDVISIIPPKSLNTIGKDGTPYQIPGDISSAAFPLVAAILLPHSDITVLDVGINPTRLGLIDVLREMGTEVKIDEKIFPSEAQSGEPIGNISVHSSELKGVEIKGDTVIRMIDEFPILAVAATQAHGETVVRDASELRVKETDRIACIVSELRKMGASIDPLQDGFIVHGPTRLHSASVSSHGDHRLAMALVVAGLIADDVVMIDGTNCTADSFPGFIEVMRQLGAQYD